MLFLLTNKKARGTSKLCFTHKDQSDRLNFELSYNERTLVRFLFFPKLFNVFNPTINET